MSVMHCIKYTMHSPLAHKFSSLDMLRPCYCNSHRCSGAMTNSSIRAQHAKSDARIGMAAKQKVYSSHLINEQSNAPAPSGHGNTPYLSSPSETLATANEQPIRIQRINSTMELYQELCARDHAMNTRIQKLNSANYLSVDALKVEETWFEANFRSLETVNTGGDRGNTLQLSAMIDLARNTLEELRQRRKAEEEVALPPNGPDVFDNGTLALTSVSGDS